MEKKQKCPEGMGWRVSVSVSTVFGLLALLGVWLFFYADAYTIYQNLGVVLASGLIFVGINAACWAPWGMKHGECECHHEKK